MFEELSDKLSEVLGRFKERGVLTEPMIRDGLREVRRVLLEADVHFQLARDFLARVEERALGEKVLRSVSPGQQIIKIVHDELVTLLGEKREGLKTAPVGPTVILLVGLQGSGKTTTAGKLARRLKREGKSPLLAALDIYRPAAIDQLETLGKQVDVPVYSDRSERDVAKLARAAYDHAQRERHRTLILDSAGRLQIDEELMDELRRVQRAVDPTETLLVVDGMIGQEAVGIAEGFNEALSLSGVVLTKLDGDARGGAALSVRGATGVPIKFMVSVSVPMVSMSSIPIGWPTGSCSAVMWSGSSSGRSRPSMRTRRSASSVVLRRRVSSISTTSSSRCASCRRWVPSRGSSR